MFDSRIKIRPILLLSVFLVAFIALLWVQSSPTFMDPDSFYHLKMIKLVGEKGIITDFPWLSFTVLKDFYIDHHYLFHVVGVAFVWLLGDMLGFKVYLVLLGSLLAAVSYYLLAKDKILLAWLWPFIMLLDVSFLFRVSLAKAVAFSLILLFLILYCLFHKKYLGALILSFIYVWSYGGFIIALVLAIIYAFSVALEKTFLPQTVLEKIAQIVHPRRYRDYFVEIIKNFFSRQTGQIVGVVALGIIIGLIINPYFPKNISFTYQQLFEIGIKNYQNVVNVGSEWHSYEIGRLFQNSGIVLSLGILSILISIFNYSKLKARNFFFFITAVLFLLATIKSQRYVEYFIPFAVMFCAYSFGLADWKEYKAYFQVQIGYKNLYSGLLILFIVFICLALPVLLVGELAKVQREFQGGQKLSYFQGISQYLIENTKEGEIIFHSDWDDFPALFYHNTKNYYLVGLDPTFMYNYSAELYRKYADITISKQSQNLFSDINGVFKANWVIVDTGYDQLERNLINDGHFEKVYQDDDGKIYRISNF